MTDEKINADSVNPVNPVDSVKSNGNPDDGENVSPRDKIKAEIAEILDMDEELEETKEEIAVSTSEPEGSASTPKDVESTADTFSPDDALVERAVRAGLALADVKAFTSKESAERVLSVIEAKSTPDKGEETEPVAEEPDMLELPEIDEETMEEIDPSIAAFIKSQNAALKALHAEIKTLKKAGTSAEAKGFFEAQYGALDESVRGHVDAVAKARLKQKFDMLEAGYKATGTKVDRETVFKEAVSISLSDAVTKAAAERSTAKIASRRGLVIAPPGGSSGKQPKATGDGEYADLVAALQEKGFN